ncbi:MAG: radical SAM protein [Dehalococcoidia bacterium]|nr:MAG: radical SAM protein [Dehalococcoidia bacterium]
MPYELPPIRPPSEAYSLLIRVMRGCPWNYCTFCAVYKGYPRKDTIRSVAGVKGDIDELRATIDHLHLQGHEGEPTTAFLADSNAIVIKTDGLTEIVRYLYEVFPSLERVTSYGRAKTVLSKKPDELRRLRDVGLTRLHLGLETGDDDLLGRVRKGATAQEMIEAGRKAKEAGFELSEYVMPGLGGKGASRQHVQGTAGVLNAIDPHYIRMRSLMLIPGTPLWDEYVAGEFEPLSRYKVVAEIGALIDGLDVTSRVCFDHMANPPIFRQDWEGYKFPEEKAAVLDLVERALKSARQQGVEATMHNGPLPSM